MELLTISLFITILIVCLLADLSILYALIAGYFLFSFYAWKKHYTLRQILRMSADGILTVKSILITFVLIGILTAFWRAAGTLPAIVCYASGFIDPSLFLLASFLLNSLISFLIGTSFGTAATMGVICMMMAQTLQISPLLEGGAILSGIFFGDRCSPVSTSALLVSELTRTNIFDNIRNMFKTALVPFLMTCLIYGLAGFLLPVHGDELLDVRALFSSEFALGLIPLLPAAVILILSLFRINVKKTMLASILTALPICLIYQRIPPLSLLQTALTGFKAGTPEIAAMMNGGGLLSMVRVSFIVCLSASFSGIFKTTGLLRFLKSRITALSRRSGSSFAVILTSVLTAIVACNQSLATVLVYQLCDEAEPDAEQLAILLENSVIVIAALVPWCIAGAVPIAAIGAPTSCLLFACYLYLIPLWQLVIGRPKYRKKTVNYIVS